MKIKKDLLKIYTDFCRRRLHRHLGFAGTITAGFTGYTTINKIRNKPVNVKMASLPMLCWGLVTYSFHRYQLAQKSDFSYLDRDILDQLNAEYITIEPHIPCWHNYKHENQYKKGWFFYKQVGDSRSCELNLDTVPDIEKALSGEYTISPKHWNQR